MTCKKTTLKRLFVCGRDAFHLLVLSYGVMLILIGMIMPIKAQQHSTERVEELGRRIDDLDALHLDHRLTVIETTLTDMVNNFTWYRISTGGTGLLLAEAVVRHVRNKRKQDDEDSGVTQ
jgi:hypothetical protein